MKKVVGYLREYAAQLNKPMALAATLFTALLVYANYHYALNRTIGHLPQGWRFAAWYLLFLTALAYGYFLQVLFLGSKIFQQKKFIALLLLAPAVFAWKMTASIHFTFSPDAASNSYWNAVVYWPVKVVVITAMLFVLHRIFDRDQAFYGVQMKGFDARPYLIMLLIMVPLIALAATQKDFLAMYPRYQSLSYLMQPDRGWQRLLYELSYGSDFFSIELYFRGFLVLAFARWAGKEAVLPMAIFYCAIHFGKPLGECISSYFGGTILGVVAYRTRTILGGFLVHVGIAWLMEAAGTLHPLSPA